MFRPRRAETLVWNTPVPRRVTDHGRVSGVYRDHIIPLKTGGTPRRATFSGRRGGSEGGEPNRVIRVVASTRRSE